MKEIPGRDWFIIHCKPKQEFDARKHLQTLGVEVYLPLYAKKVRVNRMRVERVAPLFSGYLFSRFDLRESYQKVRYTRGVKAVLGRNERLWTLADEKVQDIRSRESGGLVVLRPRQVQFRPGDRIRIDEGDFEGWEGIFREELPDRERAMILLTNVQFSSTLILPKEYLVAQR
ncbi:MAG TPA: transcription termination/antitermination NusG family protein [Candidatus Aminicenantes bacterium]|nr:transcription termination/antitermination NusG family protein [Candidatus Aminicenantes bacterium]